MPLAPADRLVPPCCGLCRHPCARSELICAHCAARLQVAPRPPARRAGGAIVTAAYSYTGIGAELVRAIKFGRRPALAAAVAPELAARLGLTARATLVPVPADPLRLRMRGFDPAGVLAQALAQATGSAVAEPLRRRHGRRQVGRGRAARTGRIPGLALRRAPPEQVVLVDDVVTTGATIGACAETLAAAGTRELCAVALASAERRLTGLGRGVG